MLFYRKIIGVSLIMILLCIYHSALAGNNIVYEQRRQNYIDTSLAHFYGNAITIQAYEGIPVDSATLYSTLANISSGLTSDFDIVKLVRVLCLSNGQYDSIILPVIYKVPYWLNYHDTVRTYWSENHMSLWMSCDWLLHEKYGKPIDSNLHKRLEHFLDLKNQYGFYEFNSHMYGPFCLAGLLNLADFAQDSVIKQKATFASQRLMSDFLRISNNKGVYYSAAGRNYYENYQNPYVWDIYNIIYLLTGFGNPPQGANEAGSFLATSTVPVDTVINSWVPVLDTTYVIGHSIDSSFVINADMDTADKVVFKWSAGEYFYPTVATETYELLTDSDLWSQASFKVFAPLSGLGVNNAFPIATALNAASESSVLCTDTISIFKHYSLVLSSIQDYWKGKWGYQQYPCVADIDTTAVYTASGQALPWSSRSRTNGNDDLPYVKQVKNVALLMYRPQPKSTLITQSNPTVSLHWMDADFTEVRNDSLWLLGRVENNYVGVRRSCVNQINGMWACEVPNGQSWVIIVGDSLMYGGFNNFQTMIDSSQFTEQWYYDSTTSQEVYFAKIIIDNDTIQYAWGVDSTLSTGVADLAINKTGLRIYPNPASCYVNIVLDNHVQQGNIDVYNMTGQIIYQGSIAENEMILKTNNWPEGLYAVKINTDSESLSKCFVVSH
jgi:Secretion system C-terminal sorting domain